MSSDDAYSSFLDQANQDTGNSEASAQSSQPAQTVNADVPRLIQNIDQYYTSESDEPFQPVSLKWDGKEVPSESDFASLIGHKSDVSSLSVEDFDPNGKYGDVVSAVEKAGNGQVKIYRVEKGRARVEYWIVGLDGEGKGGKIVGVKADAVES